MEGVVSRPAMNPRLADLIEAAPKGPGAVAKLAALHGFPLVAGDRVTFVYVGDADAVNLRHWIFGLPGTLAFTRVEGYPLWYRELELPPRSRVEYKFEIVNAGHGEWILDPLNPHRAHDPFGANSVCYGPGYEREAWTEFDPSARRGSLDLLTIRSKAFGDTRKIPVYLPARFRRGRRYPLLVVHDGNDYVKYSQLTTVLDNLIDALEIPAMVVALSNPGDRLVEYANDERHAKHIVEEIVPAMEDNYPLIGKPAHRGIMGASFGAVASLSTAWRYPGVFGRLVLQSGSFAFTDIGTDHPRSAAFDPVVEFVNAFRQAPGRPSEKVFMTCGVHESLIYENRSMRPVIQDTGMLVRYVESRDGHNWENWRDRLREGLSWLWPGPLWMTYE
jgi:enterochelin esterase-like enzyme